MGKGEQSSLSQSTTDELNDNKLVLGNANLITYNSCGVGILLAQSQGKMMIGDLIRLFNPRA
ncbi:hypothetical protein C7B76_15045 [filamentous cyanobacterium CCP2]|nr:hypothetical protein C7B76_15045 [filamentous cyanobacterium CCP2]